MCAKAKKARRRIMGAQGLRPVDLDQFDEAVIGELYQPVRGAHLFGMACLWRESEARGLPFRSRRREIPGRHYHMIDCT